MHDHHKSFLPAFGHRWALPLYDPLVRVLGGDAARRALLDQAGLRPGQRVLDVGCGTGTLAVLVKRTHPGVEVTGLDPDAPALARARRKADRAGVAVRFDLGFADALPYPDATFERVFSTLMLHHLPVATRAAALREVRRVLAPGGSLHLLDFAGAEHDGHGLVGRLLHARDRFADNAPDKVLDVMRAAGFADPREVGRRRVAFGPLAYYAATAPAATSAA